MACTAHWEDGEFITETKLLEGCVERQHGRVVGIVEGVKQLKDDLEDFEND